MVGMSREIVIAGDIFFEVTQDIINTVHRSFLTCTIFIYSTSRELKAITVMYKVPGYNPKDGDWFWVKYTPEGTAGPFGKPKGCIGCHGTRANNDFILVHEFK